MTEAFKGSTFYDIRGTVASRLVSPLQAMTGLDRELRQTNRRLEAVNRHFWLKAAELIDSPAALSLLARLSEEPKLALRQVDLRRKEAAIALAQLTGAQLCEITKREVWITARGEAFYQRVLDYQAPSSEVIPDQP